MFDSGALGWGRESPDGPRAGRGGDGAGAGDERPVQPPAAEMVQRFHLMSAPNKAAVVQLVVEALDRAYAIGRGESWKYAKNLSDSPPRESGGAAGGDGAALRRNAVRFSPPDFLAPMLEARYEDRREEMIADGIGRS